MGGSARKTLTHSTWFSEEENVWDGGGNGEEKMKRTVSLRVTTGEMQFPFLLPSLPDGGHPWAQVTTSLGILLNPGLLLGRGCPAGGVAAQSLSVHLQGPGQGGLREGVGHWPCCGKKNSKAGGVGVVVDNFQ